MSIYQPAEECFDGRMRIRDEDLEVTLGCGRIVCLCPLPPLAIVLISSATTVYCLCVLTYSIKTLGLKAVPQESVARANYEGIARNSGSDAYRR